jgi:hypothetical protein
MPERSRCGWRRCRSAWCRSASGTHAYAKKVEATLKGRGLARRDRRPQRKDERQDSRLRQPEGSVHSGLRRQGRRRGSGERAHARQGRPGIALRRWMPSSTKGSRSHRQDDHPHPRRSRRHRHAARPQLAFAFWQTPASKTWPFFNSPTQPQTNRSTSHTSASSSPTARWSLPRLTTCRTFPPM